MKQKLLTFLGVLLTIVAQAQTTDEKANRQAIIDQIKKEILDSLRKNPTLLDKGAPTADMAPAANGSAKIPFDGIETSWQNGSDRRDSSLFQGKYFTPYIMVDMNYTHSYNNPNDNTVVG